MLLHGSPRDNWIHWVLDNAPMWCALFAALTLLFFVLSQSVPTPLLLASLVSGIASALLGALSLRFYAPPFSRLWVLVPLLAVPLFLEQARAGVISIPLLLLLPSLALTLAYGLLWSCRSRLRRWLRDGGA